MRICVGDYFLY